VLGDSKAINLEAGGEGIEESTCHVLHLPNSELLRVPTLRLSLILSQILGLEWKAWKKIVFSLDLNLPSPWKGCFECISFNLGCGIFMDNFEVIHDLFIGSWNMGDEL
jgi:hypothetical protein